MFGGHGVYHNGLMFGPVANDELYLKADKDSAKYFEALGLHQFEYTSNERRMNMSYYLAPEEIFEDSETAKTWAQRAYSASRAKKPKKRPSK